MKLFFFGDSICFGQFVSPHQTWVVKIAANLSQSLADNYTVINSSINGNTTRMALERMAFDVQAHGVDAIYIQFGMNDCNYWQSDNGVPRVSLPSFQANLLEIIQRARVFGARHIWLATNHPTPKVDLYSYAPVSYQKSNEAYNQVIRSVANDAGVILIDHEAEWRRCLSNGYSLPDLVLPDGIHLSPLGHEIYFSFVLPIIRQTLG